MSAYVKKKKKKDLKLPYDLNTSYFQNKKKTNSKSVEERNSKDQTHRPVENRELKPSAVVHAWNPSGSGG